MTLSGVLGMGRAQTLTRFTETFKVFTVARGPLGEDGLYTDVEVSIKASHPGQVKFPTLTVQERDQGAQTPAVQDIVVKVEVGSVSAPLGSFWRVLTSSVDPSLVGRVFRTKGLPQAGTVTAHRYPVESVS